MTSRPAPLWLYAPLWGVRFDSDAVGLVGGAVLASVPYPDEWRSVQKSAIADERRRVDGGRSELESIPFCLTASAERDEDEPIHEGVQRIGGELLAQLRRSVLALRLAQPGWFLDPEFAEIVFAIDDAGWRLLRRPGPYRQAFLAPGTKFPLPGYELAIADLTSSRDEPGPVQRWWEALDRACVTAGCAPLEIALDNFSRSFGLVSPSGDRLAHLFIALEALLGGFDGRAPGGVTLGGSSGKLYGRLKNALVTSGLEPIAAGREAAWLCGADPGEGRWLRNRVAHGEVVTDGMATIAVQLRAQDAVRRLLRSCVQFFDDWHKDGAALAASLGLAPGTTPIGAFNRSLTNSPPQVPQNVL